jgi:vacuolar-type H+-ATPase subunit H
MFDPVTQSELSPLDQIRKAELEATRRIAEARGTAEQAITRAHSQAELLRIQAREAGQRDGQALYQETIAKAEEQAQVLVSLAHQRAEDLRRTGELRMGIGVNRAIKLILDLEEEVGE